MSTYLFRCSKCKKEFDLKFTDGPPKDAPRIGHYNKKGIKCHGALVRVYTPPNIRIK